MGSEFCFSMNWEQSLNFCFEMVMRLMEGATVCICIAFDDLFVYIFRMLGLRFPHLCPARTINFCNDSGKLNSLVVRIFCRCFCGFCFKAMMMCV